MKLALQGVQYAVLVWDRFDATMWQQQPQCAQTFTVDSYQPKDWYRDLSPGWSQGSCHCASFGPLSHFEPSCFLGQKTEAWSQERSVLWVVTWPPQRREAIRNRQVDNSRGCLQQFEQQPTTTNNRTLAITLRRWDGVKRVSSIIRKHPM
jgi:hypothetical protein